ncbi:hypothetical protein [Natrinema sp. CBA1119]|uniref:hypothetical protein n=1 Tax=Natrinema sp. CBA1119 TaxID=1608465 RepID=UPI001145B0C0|nr:hypothetical protein [Natrinema sp. CBA1119]
MSDILIETPSLHYKTTPHWRKAWENYDSYEVSKAKSSSLKRTLYVTSIYTIIAFFAFSALLMVSLPLLFDAPEENAGPGEAEVDGDPEAAEATGGDTNSAEATDSSERTDTGESSSADLVSDVTSLDDLDGQLRGDGLQVEFLDGGSDYVWLDYVTAANSDQEMRQEVETVAVSYAELVNSGSPHGSELMQAIFMDGSGNDLGNFFIMHDWAQQYANGRYP